MKTFNVVHLIIGIASFFWAKDLYAQFGYYDAPYVRYEADQGILTNASVTPKSFSQGALQSEASEQVCVNLFNASASVSWTVLAPGDGLVVRYSVPDTQSGVLEVYADNVLVGTLNLTTYYSWEYLSSNGDPNNGGVVNTNPKMRFDEVRMKLPAKILAGGNLKLVRQSGNITIDFAELEAVPASVASSSGNAVYTGNGSDLQNFINSNGGNTIYLPAGTYNVNSVLYFGVNNTVLKGAGMWYTEIHFTNGSGNSGGLVANASNVSYSGLYLSTVRNSRTNSYKGINGIYTSGSTITNVWAEHFECGAWIAQYNTGGPAVADGFTMSNCRFRNNYADGTNLCKGTVNAMVEHCSYRNNGDDDMAIWPANNQSCDNNTFRYNTSENTWRASGCAIYGGSNNKAYNLLIRDNLEAGLRVNNSFPGTGFSTSGTHQFYNINIIRCGTNNDLFNNPVGAIDLLCNDVTGTRLNNVKFSCINITDAKNDAIYFNRINSGEGFYNLVFENITIDGTGKEYPSNNVGSNTNRGFDVLFVGYPSGNTTYCNMTYANRGGNATVDVNTNQLGSMSWTQPGTCPGGCIAASSTAVTSPSNGSLFDVCNGPINITASATAPAGNTVSYVEFFVDGVTIGTDNTAAYAASWNSPIAGNHTLTAVAHYTPSNTTSTSSVVNITVGGIVQTGTAPVIDGTAEALWNNFPANNLNHASGGVTAPDLAATYKMTYDVTYLYLLVDVTDDVLIRDGTGGTWEDDGIEIFIDMGNDKSTTYGLNDYQYSFNWNSTAIIENKHNATAGISFAQTNRTGGYTMEIAIPWSTLGSSPAAGSDMGFDVGVNDDDDHGTRDNQLSWNDASFGEYNNPQLFGTVEFSSCAPLPVTLILFTGKAINETVVLNWTTAMEVNNEKFMVERSTDASAWQVIGEVAGAGHSNAIISYGFIDYTHPNQGIVYYRLRQVDWNGAFVFSKIVAIQFETSFSNLSIFPNPFEEGIGIKSDLAGAMEISIHDVLGRLMYHNSLESGEGTIRVQPLLPSGTYVLTIQSGEIIAHHTIVKK